MVLSSGRENLKFSQEVEIIFSFLEDMGFLLKIRTDILVEYIDDVISVFLNHGQQSYEIGCEIFNHGVGYYISEIISIYDIDFGEKYRDTVASTPQDVRRRLMRLREIFMKYAIDAVSGDADTFTKLATQRKQWAKALELKTKLSSIKPRADEAFRARNYAKASELYDQIRDALIPSETRKADLTRKLALRQPE